MFVVFDVMTSLMNNDRRQTLIIPLVVHYLPLHFAAFLRFHVNLHQLTSVMCWEQ
jgi:hypothetical protein